MFVWEDSMPGLVMGSRWGLLGPRRPDLRGWAMMPNALGRRRPSDWIHDPEANVGGRGITHHILAGIISKVKGYCRRALDVS